MGAITFNSIGSDQADLARQTLEELQRSGYKGTEALGVDQKGAVVARMTDGAIRYVIADLFSGGPTLIEAAPTPTPPHYAGFRDPETVAA